MKLSNILKHLKKICTHKYWVFYYCCKCGIPIQGLLHDLSKFSFIEFWEGVKYYKGDSSPIDQCKKINGVSYAWQHHKGRNKHHYEYWVDKLDHGGECLAMPFKYRVEMLCDFLGAGVAYNGRKNFTYEGEYQWWVKRKEKFPNMMMNTKDKEFIDEMLLSLADKGEEITFTKIKKMLKEERKK